MCYYKTLCIHILKKSIPVSLMLFLQPALNAQPVKALTLADLYAMAKVNYPLIRQKDLLSKSFGYTVENLARGYLPVFSLNAQSTYQSAVTSFPFKIPIPGFTLPNYSKDQYKINGEMDQLLYDGGLIKTGKKQAAVNDSISEQNVEIAIYPLADRITQLFFGVILLDEQLNSNKIVNADIQNGIDRTGALLANGQAFKSNLDILKAQQLQTMQSSLELGSARRSSMEMIGLFINRTLEPDARLELPADPILNQEVNRPELLLYNYQIKAYDLQDHLLEAQIRPKVSLFVQGGYGRPGLNMLSNNFDWYYLGGIRLNWNLGNLYTLKNQKQINALNRKIVDAEKQTFLFNVSLSNIQQTEDISKSRKLILIDDSIISLRRSVKMAALAQLENGVITARDYITEVNAEDQARSLYILHKIQLLLAQYNYLVSTGNLIK